MPPKDDLYVHKESVALALAAVQKRYGKFPLRGVVSKIVCGLRYALDCEEHYGGGTIGGVAAFEGALINAEENKKQPARRQKAVDISAPVPQPTLNCGAYKITHFHAK